MRRSHVLVPLNGQHKEALPPLSLCISLVTVLQDDGFINH